MVFSAGWELERPAETTRRIIGANMREAPFPGGKSEREGNHRKRGEKAVLAFPAPERVKFILPGTPNLPKGQLGKTLGTAPPSMTPAARLPTACRRPIPPSAASWRSPPLF